MSHHTTPHFIILHHTQLHDYRISYQFVSLASALIQPPAIDPITDHLKESDDKVNKNRVRMKKRVRIQKRMSMRIQNSVK